MRLELSSGLVTRLDYLIQVDSTNLEIARRNTQNQLPNFSALVAGEQTAGQGRLGRTWISAPNSSISLSILLRTSAKFESLGWVNLIAGVAMQATIAQLCPGAQVFVKWPNDVLVAGKKIAGILSAIQPDGAIVLGVGLNLLPQQGAPETATSLSELGCTQSFDEVLATFLTHFRARWSIFDADQQLGISKTQAELRVVCSTLGQSVRAELPGGEIIHGIAEKINEHGQLVILRPEPLVLSAADVWHLRN